MNMPSKRGPDPLTEPYRYLAEARAKFVAQTHTTLKVGVVGVLAIALGYVGYKHLAPSKSPAGSHMLPPSNARGSYGK